VGLHDLHSFYYENETTDWETLSEEQEERAASPADESMIY